MNATNLYTADDSGLLAYADYLIEQEKHEYASLIQNWIKLKGKFKKKDKEAITCFNKNFTINFPTKFTYEPDGYNQFIIPSFAVYEDQLGEFYTTLSVTTRYLSRLPSTLDKQPFRKLKLTISDEPRNATRLAFKETPSLNKLWWVIIDASSFMVNIQVGDLINRMPLMHNCKYFEVLGRRQEEDLDYVIGSIEEVAPNSSISIKRNGETV